MIKKIKETLSQVFFSKDSTKLPFWDESDIECAIDENIVDCAEMDEEPYTGVPAPVVLTEDPWFGPAVVSDANKDYMEHEYEAFKQDALNYYNQDTKEPENIHQVMYEMATQNWTTVVETQGGSENVWQSGTGHYQ